MANTEKSVRIDYETQQFYDEYWPKYVPYYQQTREYMFRTIRERHTHVALDAGCGHGVCSVVLSEIADHVTAVDISQACLTTAQEVAGRHARNNIRFLNQDLQFLSLEDDQFDLVWCWGVAMMAPDPVKVIRNLVRVCKPNGVIYLGLYKKTWLSPIHELVRHFCRRYMATPHRKRFVMNFFAWLTVIASRLKGNVINLRPDNVSIQAQVEDWYYPPYKTFYSIKEAIAMLEMMGVRAECVQEQVGRMKSATIFVLRGVKSK
ncbi:MAG: class I SAM-dependent methyltransferase [Nitrospira sp.]|nr:class I SAM-dependent methyltransferase [Nitrospira sp.]